MGRARAGFGPGLLLGLALLLANGPANADLLHYDIDQHDGSIGFSVSQLGLFAASGHFTRFAGTLAIDVADPSRSRIDVTIEAASAAMASDQAVAMLRSADYFDAAKYPSVHFVSESIARSGDNRFTIHGTLTIRGISRAQTLAAFLVREQQGAGGGRIDDFRLSGTLSRSQYGMTANEDFVGDAVSLSIFIRLRLPASGAGR